MLPVWNTLLKQAETRPQISELFDQNSTRVRDFSAEACGLYFDYSKTAITSETLNGLLALAVNVPAARKAMFAGEKINTTEGRAVLHTALRAPDNAVIMSDGADVMPELRATRARMQTFANDIRTGRIKGQGGPITDVVNIGIGGSDLGPAMASAALAPFHDGPRTHFVSNVDGAHIADTLKTLDATTTLVLVASKTFTTIETMTNAETARAWMAKTVTDTGAQFAAISTSEEKAAAMGIASERVFGFEDWVGGRYSVWGPIGLSLMLAIGPDNFDAFLAGAAELDEHFQTAKPAQNLPILLALVGLWNQKACGYASRAVLPYDQRLEKLPAYLQQLEMESNGKPVAKDGSPLPLGSGPVVWGTPGTNGQHAYFQLLHQGTEIVPAEFLVAMRGHEPDLTHHHALLVANCLAQSQALMLGRSLDDAREIAAKLGFEGAELEAQAAQRTFAGNRPSTTLAYEQLTPAMLGKIIALYEHRVFVEGVILGINSFDQFGVELGKEKATALLPVLEGASDGGLDSSTATLAARFRKVNKA
ncbi:glucose-6-phosphate isomerase [Lentibacter algarum]|uniref:glucose-6-phosphate isomerase n=1 Tax=Lentibacter algarum TaxID=576131 RepID=UPI001C0A5780|nr:glucose-6-phosphate isomerase [Lentibacter algarum]MBU2982502.1 glucose-6-phosphate isomerase [Lentibacter algarum]